MAYQPGTIPAPTVQDGNRNIVQVLAARVIPQIEDKILFRDPNAAPVLVFTKAIRGKTSVPNRRFSWLYQDEYPRLSAVADATRTAADVTINVPAGEGARFPNFAWVLNTATREVFRVTSVAVDALTVTRPANAQPMIGGQPLIILGTAFQDGAGHGSYKTVQDVEQFNYTQIIRTGWGYTKRQKNTDLYGGRDPKVLKERATVRHTKDMEFVALFGRRSLTAGAAGPEITTTMGLEEAIEPYSVWDLEGQRPTFQEFNRVLEYAMAEGDGGYIASKGNATKYLIYSPAWATLFDEWWMDKIRYATDDKGLGLKIGFVETGHGRIGLMKHPLLTGPHAGMAFLLDFNHIEFRYHEGGDTQLYENIQANDVKTEEHEYYTDFGLKIDAQFRQHTIFKNLGAAA